MNRGDDLEILAEAKPYIRSVTAFLLYLRFGGASYVSPATCYASADEFLAQLQKDIATK